MTHSVRKLTSVSSDDITRLFEDCKSKILEGTLPFEGEPTEANAEVYFSIGIPNALAMPQCEVFGYFKDDYLCFIRYALVTDGVLGYKKWCLEHTQIRFDTMSSHLLDSSFASINSLRYWFFCLCLCYIRSSVGLLVKSSLGIL